MSVANDNMAAAIELRQQELAEMIEIVIDCKRCEGKGTIPDEWPSRVNRPYEEQTMSCPECQGLGEISKEVMTCCQKSDYLCTCLD